MVILFRMLRVDESSGFREMLDHSTEEIFYLCARW